ncbi:MAG: NUDIX hydrolase [Anaerolineae bacterium]|nr:NUDIX hydrolase [Anaerolineae bacterium]
MLATPVYFNAAALIWSRERSAPHGDLLLVQQQGPDDHQPYWALPGGRVVSGELLLDGLCREVREETGVQIAEVGELVYTARLDNPSHGYQSHTRVFSVNAWQGRVLPADPDHLILDVAFFPFAEAVRRLAAIPWLVMRQPLLAYLQGNTSAGCVWLYNQDGDDPPTLIARLQGPARA